VDSFRDINKLKSGTAPVMIRTQVLSLQNVIVPTAFTAEPPWKNVFVVHAFVLRFKVKYE